MWGRVPEQEDNSIQIDCGHPRVGNISVLVFWSVAPTGTVPKRNTENLEKRTQRKVGTFNSGNLQQNSGNFRYGTPTQQSLNGNIISERP